MPKKQKTFWVRRGAYDYDWAYLYDCDNKPDEDDQYIYMACYKDFAATTGIKLRKKQLKKVKIVEVKS